MTRVLALRALGLGDLLTGIPALRGVARAWPEAELMLAAPEAVGRWLLSLGVVDAVLPTTGLVPLSAEAAAPDVAVNLHGCGPQSHRLLQQLSPRRLVAYAAPLAGHDDGPAWDADEHEVDRWIRLVRWAGASCEPADLLLASPGPRQRHVVVHPGAAFPSRRWPAERWASVAAALAGQDRRVVVTGVAAEADLCRVVAGGHPHVENRCGTHRFAELAQLVGTAALLVCGDTGVAHLATAYRTPSVLLFGPVSPAQWGPRIDLECHRVLWQPAPGDPPGDPHGSEVDVRLARITVEQVLAAASTSLADAGSSR